MADDEGDYEDVYEEEVEMEDDLELDDDVKQRDLGNELLKLHPEARIDTLESVEQALPLLNVPPSFLTAEGKTDSRHKSVPFLTQYEKTKILGFRTNQLSLGAKPYITVPEHVSELREIAKLELEARRLPIIIKRPMPDGTFEMWRLSDLLIL
jgi:DNA-directed RNA polymerase subunit K/omega